MFLPLALLAALLTCLASQAQQTPIEQAAAALLGEYVPSASVKVVVVDFSGPKNDLTALGVQLAQDLRIALTKFWPDLEVVDRKQWQAILTDQKLGPVAKGDSKETQRVSAQLGATLTISGVLKGGKRTVDLVLTLWDNRVGKKAAEHRVTLPLTVEAKALLAKRLEPPQCEYCPNPTVPEVPRGSYVSVIVKGFLDEFGHFTEVRVIKSPGKPMEKAALEAVQKWRIRPARDPEGKAIGSWLVIEVVVR